MKCLYVTDVFPPHCGGSGWSVYFFARALREQGHEVTIVCLDGKSRRYDDFDVQGVELFSSEIPFYRNWKRHASSLPAIAERLMPMLDGHDVSHAHHKWSSLALSLAGARNMFVTIRDYWPICICGRSIFRTDNVCSTYDYARCSGDDNIWKGLAAPLTYPWFAARMSEWQEFLGRAKKIFCISHFLRDQLAFRFPNDQLLVLPNIAEDLTPWLAHEELEGLDQTFLVFVGRLEKNKGAHLLPQIMKSTRLNVPLVIVGEGSLREDLEREFEKHNLDVWFTGYQEYPQMLSILKHSAIVLFPSVWPEPLGRVLIEAGMMSKPSVAFNHPGGHHDIIRNQVNGILADSLEGFAEAIRDLITNQSRAEILGQNARSVYQENFTPDAVMPRLLHHYRNEN